MNDLFLNFAFLFLNYIQQYKSATQQAMPPDIQPGTQNFLPQSVKNRALS